MNKPTSKESSRQQQSLTVVHGEDYVVPVTKSSFRYSAVRNFAHHFKSDDDLRDRVYGHLVVCAVAGVPESSLSNWLSTGLLSGRLRSHVEIDSPSLYSFSDVMFIRLMKRLREFGVAPKVAGSALFPLAELQVSELLQVTLVGSSNFLMSRTPDDGPWAAERPHGSDVFGISLHRVALETWEHLCDFQDHSFDRSLGASGPDDVTFFSGAENEDYGVEPPFDEWIEALGEAVSVEEASADSAWHSRARERAQRAVLRQSIPKDAAAAALGEDESAILKLIEDGSLFAVENQGEIWVPSWQLTGAGVLLPGLTELVANFPGDVAAVTEWVQLPNPDLGYLTPLAALQAARSEEVQRVVLGLTAAAW